jgi:hypothetical protein
VVNGLALTCKLHVWHSWEDPETATGAYGNFCKPAHTVHVVNNFHFHFSFNFNERQARYLQDLHPFVGSMTLAYRKGALNEAYPLSRRSYFVPMATVPLF